MKKKTVKTPSKRPRKGKIWILATDPFSGLDLQPLWSLVKPLAQIDQARVEATYVLAPASFNWNGEFTAPWIKRYRPVAEEKLTAALPGAEVLKTVIVCKESGLSDAVNAISAYARKAKAEFIMVLTHARSGLERVTLGSFAETLILTSPNPVLVVNPSHTISTSVRKILISTDLKRRSEKFVLAVAALAARWGAEVVLYHRHIDPLDPVIQQGVYALGGGWMTFDKYNAGESKNKAARMNHLEAKIRKIKVNVSHIFDTAGSASLTEGIEASARDSGSDLIAASTGASALRANVVGSVARGLVRTATVPVLIWR